MLYWFAVMWVGLASSRGCGKVCSRSFKDSTGMGEAGLGGVGIAAGGHVASADMLRTGFTIIHRLHNIYIKHVNSLYKTTGRTRERHFVHRLISKKQQRQATEFNALKSVLKVVRMILASRAAVWRWSRSSERRDPSLLSPNVFCQPPAVDPTCCRPLTTQPHPSTRRPLLGVDSLSTGETMVKVGARY